MKKFVVLTLLLLGAVRSSGQPYDYKAFTKKITALPDLPKKQLDWPKFYEQMQVIDLDNQLSCTGFTVARALRLTHARKGNDFVPSPEFLYDIGAAYYDLFVQGDLRFPFKPLVDEKPDERTKLIQKRFLDLRKKKNEAPNFSYPPSATIFVLDYAAKNPIPSRDDYRKHFSEWEASKLKDAGLRFLDFPPLRESLKGEAFGYYENEQGQRLKSLDEFSGTKSRLAGFDFSLVSLGLSKGYFPILDINTDHLTLEANDFVSYAPGGSVGHSIVIVGEGKEDFEILDSWADEKTKLDDKKYTMKIFKIRKDTLEKKIIRFSLIH